MKTELRMKNCTTPRSKDVRASRKNDSRVLSLARKKDALMDLVKKHGSCSHRTIQIIFLGNARIDDRRGEFRKSILANPVAFLTLVANESPNDPAKRRISARL